MAIYEDKYIQIRTNITNTFHFFKTHFFNYKAIHNNITFTIIML